MTRSEVASRTTRPARPLRVGVWCRTLDLEHGIRDTFVDMADVTLAVVPKGHVTSAASAAWADDCEVLIVDVDLADANEFDLLSRILEVRGARRPVIATASSAAVDDVRRLMRLGISDFLPQPVLRADLEHSLHNVAARLAQHDTPARKGAIALFMRASGGAGATTLATHTSFAMSARTPQRKIALLDLDLQRGTAGLHMDVASDVGVVNCLERFPDIEPGLIEGIATKHKSGIDFFGSGGNRWPLDDYAPEAIAQLLDVVRRIYDLVIIDAPPAWTRWHHELLARTDVAVVALQKSVTQLRLARGLVDMLQADLDAERIVTVCNRVQQGWFGRDLSKGDVQLALGRDVDLSVPGDDALVSEAVNLGVPVSQLKSGSKFEKAVLALADEIEQRIARRNTAVRSEPAEATVNGWGNDARRAAE
jgi:pilus assembly protein CpaE